jgi:hypothetical protein
VEKHFLLSKSWQHNVSRQHGKKKHEKTVALHVYPTSETGVQFFKSNNHQENPDVAHDLAVYLDQKPSLGRYQEVDQGQASDAHVHHIG